MGIAIGIILGVPAGLAVAYYGIIALIKRSGARS